MIRERTCVICRNKMSKDLLYRFNVLNGEIVVDLNHRLSSYGYYFCKENKKCYAHIDKWKKKKKSIKSL